MDGKAVCRVMLYSYQKLEGKCRVIDMHIKTKAIHSAFRNTMATYKEIEQLTSEKIAYINTKVIIDQALATLYRKYELEQHHLKGVSIEQLASEIKLAENTILSRAQRQRDALYEAILRIYTAEELLDIICDSEWLMSMYKRELKANIKRANSQLSVK